MTRFHEAYLERERSRFARPDAHRFIRSDWRRYAQPHSDLETLYDDYERKYRPDQARVPRGNPEGGQWTDEGSGGRRQGDRGSYRATVELSAAGRRRGSGHHYVPRGVVKEHEISDEAAQVFERAKTGFLLDERSNKWDHDHRVYNKAVSEALTVYLNKAGVSADKMTADQAREFLGQVFESADPRIRNFNMGIQMRELMRRLFRRGGGRE